MRRSLILVVAAAVPMAVLLRSYALEDRLSRAALEVQATETVVSGQDRGAVAVYVDRINRGTGIETTVLYPDGTGIGPHPGEDARVVEARTTGQARVDDVEGGAEFLVPVSLGGSSAGPDQTPVIRVDVHPPGLESDIVRAWLVLFGLGLALLAAALVLADRLGRSFVRPLEALAAHTRTLDTAPPPVDGPPEVRALGLALGRLVVRVQDLLARERRGIADLSHRLRTPMTALRLRIDALADAEDRARLGADLDELQALVDRVVRQARRGEGEGVVAVCDALAVLPERVRFWQPLAEDQGRGFDLTVSGAEALVPSSADDLDALVDVLLDNVFTHTPEGAAVAVSVTAGPDAVVLVVEDAGPGLPPGLDVADRGTSGAGSTGLGLAIAAQTVASLDLDASPALGGTRVTATLTRLPD